MFIKKGYITYFPVRELSVRNYITEVICKFCSFLEYIDIKQLILAFICLVPIVNSDKDNVVLDFNNHYPFVTDIVHKIMEPS